MEKRDEKPPGPPKTGAQVSETSFSLGDPELAGAQAPQPDPLGLRVFPGSLQCFGGFWSPLTFIHSTFLEAPCISSLFNFF